MLGVQRVVTIGRPNMRVVSLKQMHDMLPPLKAHYGSMPEVLPAEGPRRARVALFTGCAGDAFFPKTNLATAKVLQRFHEVHAEYCEEIAKFCTSHQVPYTRADVSVPFDELILRVFRRGGFLR